MEVSGSFRASLLYPLEKCLYYPMGKLDETLSRSGCGEVEENLLLLLGIEPQLSSS
jgi:hypothetical protein